ncbi:MAG: hypothetical protein K2O65_05240 [Lachnospiraceae bacterium]|nr:hypothetical protein [Lachnospiraceae bacterium]
MEKTSIYRNICSAIIITFLAFWLFFLRYDVPLYGDDVGWLVSNNPDNTYLDDRVVEGECTLNLDYSLIATWRKIESAYATWDGRVISRVIASLIRWMFSLPDGVNWILFSFYVATIVLVLFLLTIQVICGSMRAGMNAPVLILLTGVLLFIVPSYSYAYMTRLLMYVFTNIYVVSVILYLVFYMLIRRTFGQTADVEAERQTTHKELTINRLIGINAIGLLAGLSHEAYGVIFGAVLLTQLVRFWLENHRKISIRYLFMYIGYLAGFCICFFAPGNFNRASQSHESTLRTVTLGRRLFNSIYIHTFVAYKVWILPIIVIPILTLAIIVLLHKRILTWREIIVAVAHNLEWFLGFAMSAVTWGLVARVVNYGMLAANVLLIIGVVRILCEWWRCVVKYYVTKERQINIIRQVSAGISLAVVLIIVAGNCSEFMTVHQTADVWREHIRLARKVGMEEISVPAYPTDLNPKFYEPEVINHQSLYDKPAYRVVYGTRIVLEQQ